MKICKNAKAVLVSLFRFHCEMNNTCASAVLADPINKMIQKTSLTILTQLSAKAMRGGNGVKLSSKIILAGVDGTDVFITAQNKMAAGL